MACSYSSRCKSNVGTRRGCSIVCTVTGNRAGSGGGKMIGFGFGRVLSRIMFGTGARCSGVRIGVGSVGVFGMGVNNICALPTATSKAKD